MLGLFIISATIHMFFRTILSFVSDEYNVKKNENLLIKFCLILDA